MTRRRLRPDWRKGLDALRKLIDDPDNTRYAFELVDSVDPDAHERILGKLRKHEDGRRLVEARPRLSDLLCDRETLAFALAAQRSAAEGREVAIAEIAGAAQSR